MVTFSAYPADPRPRRAVESLLKEGMMIDLICLADDKEPGSEKTGALNIRRLSIRHRRGGKLVYVYQYSTFILATAALFAWGMLRRRYDLAYVHNMPDVLVASVLIPKAFGAKVILDQHDPMPELMTTIYNLDHNSLSVRLIKWLEKWSIARANLVITVNIACKRLFSERSCSPDKIGVVMNAPDESIFGFRALSQRPEKSRARNDKFVIMYHGSIVERNGLDLAVAALAQIGPSIPSAELRIYGRKTPFLDKVLGEAHNRGLQDCVRYLGPRRLEELVREIEDCDVGIIPNQRSAFTNINTPTRIFEYLALGKPVIAPRTPGIQDYFSPESLYFFESGDAEQLASQLHRVFSHPDDVTATVQRGQEVLLSHAWSSERHTLLNLIRSLLNDGKSGTSQLAVH
jgi:glycosyltransferase involved in cell wall biosynthesis